MFEKNVKHRANDASNDGHRPPLQAAAAAEQAMPDAVKAFNIQRSLARPRPSSGR